MTGTGSSTHVYKAKDALPACQRVRRVPQGQDPTKAEATWYEHLGKLGTVPFAVMGIALEADPALDRSEGGGYIVDS